MPEDRRDIRAERVLERLQIPFTFEPDFPLAEIERPADGTQIRATTGARSTIDEYSVAYASGAEFPALIAHRSTKKLIDGNTRYAGATKARIERHPVYFVDAKTPRLAEIVQGAMNQLNGERLSNEQAIETARLMHDQGYGPEEIARFTGRRLSTVQETIKVIDLEKRADTLGLPVEGLSKNIKAELAGIQLDTPLELVTKAVVSKGISRDDVREVNKALAATHSEAEAVEVVREHVATWDKKATPPKQQVPKEKGRPVRQAASVLVEKVRRIRWELLPDADYAETMASLEAVNAAIATVPAR